MNTQTYHQTRADMSADFMRTYDGNWVAFSADGTEIVAAASSLAELDRLVVAAGKDPESVGYEWIEIDDS